MVTSRDVILLVVGFLVGFTITNMMKSARTALVNEETIEWTDRKGRARKIVVHRRVLEQ